MAASNVQTSAVAVAPRPTQPTQQNAASPPSKRDLASWWKNFKKARKDEEKGECLASKTSTPLQQPLASRVLSSARRKVKWGRYKKATLKLQGGPRFSAKQILCNTSEDLAKLLRSQLAGA